MVALAAVRVRCRIGAGAEINVHDRIVQHVRVGGQHHVAVVVRKKQIRLGALADDLQLGVQRIQLIALWQGRFLHQILGCAFRYAHHLVQRLIAVPGKIILEQHPFRTAHQHDAQHHQGGHRGEERHGNTLAHY